MGEIIKGTNKEEGKYKEDVKVLLYNREFLNMPTMGSSAHVIAKVEFSKSYRGDKLTGCWLSPTIDIADCGNKIHLSLSTAGEKEITNTMYKLNKLINILTELRSTITKGVKEVEKNKKKLSKEG